MQKIFAVIIIVITLSACSFLKNKSSEPIPRKDVTCSEIDIENSSMYFALADVALSENNYIDAYSFLMKAYKYNTQSPEVLAKLAPLMLDIAEQQKNDDFYNKLFEIGRKARNDKVKSDVLYHSVARAYINKDEIKKANEYMDLMKKTTSNLNYLLLYYHFNVSFFDKEKDSVLKEAFNSYRGEENFQELLLITAELTPDKVLKYTKKFYKKHKDKESLHLLIMVYRKTKKEDEAIKFLKSKLKENTDIDIEDLRFFVSYLYYIKDDKDAIIEYIPKCSDDAKVSSMLILSYYDKKNYNAALNCFKQLDNLTTLSDIFGDHLYQDLKFRLYLYTKNYDETYKILDNIKKPSRKITLLGVATYSDKDTILAFLNYVKNHSQNDNIYHFYMAAYHKALDDMVAMENDLDKLSEDFVSSDERLSDLIGVLYLYASDNVDKAKRVLSYSANDSVSVNYLVALNYKAMHKDSLAIKYILEDLKTNNEPTISELYLIAQLLKTQEGYEDILISLYENAMERYPSSPNILNLFGYYIADYSINDRYAEAENALLKAIKMSPDEINYIDSIAWLYYRMEEYDKALEWIIKIPGKEIKVSEIAYHLGIIYFKKNQIEKAKLSFKYAIELNDSPKVTNLAKQKLQELGERNN